MPTSLITNEIQRDGQSAVSASNARYSWRDLDEMPPTAQRQASLFGDVQDVTTYGSGCSAKWDFEGYALVGMPVGVTATELSGSMIQRVARYTIDGGKVFVDSGAFAAFRSGQELDFERVFSTYQSVIDQGSPAALLMVGPDVIGNQRESLKLQGRYAGLLHRWVDAGVEVIIPIQSGHAAPAKAQLAINKVMKGRKWCVGIPSNAQAWSPEEITSFAEATQPARIHLLGLSRSNRLAQIAAEITRVSPTTVISCDACRLLAHLGHGRRLTDRTQGRLAAAVESVAIGETECEIAPFSTFFASIFYEANALSAEEAGEVGTRMGLAATEVTQFRSAAQASLAVACAELDPDEEWAVDAAASATRQVIYDPMVRRALSGPVRAWEVARLACGTDPDFWRAARADLEH